MLSRIAFRRVWWYVLAASFGFTAIHGRWVQAAGAAALADRCDSAVVQSARAAVKAVFGSVESRPIIRCLTRPVLGVRNQVGRTDFFPGFPAVVLLGELGSNVDVAAHEWTHAELAERVGVYRRTFVVPVWFDEGLAMQADGRAEYSYAALQRYLESDVVSIPTLQHLSHQGFYASGQQGRLNYAMSKCIVGGWMRDNPNWVEALKAMKWGSRTVGKQFQVAAQDCRGEAWRHIWHLVASQQTPPNKAAGERSGSH